MDTEKKNEILMNIEGSIATLTVNRPQIFNALDAPLLCRMEEFLNEAEADTEVRALVITGAGEKSFISGTNINELREMTPAGAKRFIEASHGFFDRVEKSRLPSVALINGHCLGGGLELAMCCDIRVCSKNARLGLPEINVGMIPGTGGTIRLPRIVGLGHAKDMILRGRILGAEEAKSIGLVSEVYEDVETLKAQGMNIARELASKPPQIVSIDKQLIAEAFSGMPEGFMMRNALALAYCFTTKDSLEGLNAFLEKRKPNYIGK